MAYRSNVPNQQGKTALPQLTDGMKRKSKKKRKKRSTKPLYYDSKGGGYSTKGKKKTLY